MSKAYDRVEWPFLRAIMSRLGFAEQWILRIMDCVSSAEFSVLINGVARGRIVPSRGPKARGSVISVFVYFVCRGIVTCFEVRL